MAKKQRHALMPIGGYVRLAYQCIRCTAMFASKTGPEPFCESCRSYLKADLKACWCFSCIDAPEMGLNNPTWTRMIVCPDCGNKRCPRATHHDHACTNSNEPGQHGSIYGDWQPADVQSEDKP
jgi:DNA-directed RNA polymerase subunit RPC12/RpoP